MEEYLKNYLEKRLECRGLKGDVEVETFFDDDLTKQYKPEYCWFIKVTITYKDVSVKVSDRMYDILMNTKKINVDMLLDNFEIALRNAALKLYME